MKNNCVIIIGPTASGKTKLAFELALERGGEIINADSMQIYDHFRILTARPSKEECEAYACVPYHLDGVLSGHEKASVGWWVKMASACLEGIWERGRLPIVVGGTGMYIMALMEGLSDVPDISEDVRVYVRNLAKMHSLSELHTVLASHDPKTPMYKDKQRLTRALEVILQTGQPLQFFQHKKQRLVEAEFEVHRLLPPRESLYERINHRFDVMMEEGALREVKNVMAQNLNDDHPILGATGYRELRAYLFGEMSLEEAVSKAKQHSRNYAKRQYTWIGRQLKSEN